MLPSCMFQIIFRFRLVLFNVAGVFEACAECLVLLPWLESLMGDDGNSWNLLGLDLIQNEQESAL